MFSSDAILQTIGTIIGTTSGAFLGGYYAVRVMRKQIDFQKTILEQEKKEKFEKTYWLIKVAFGVLGDAMTSTSKTLSDPATGDRPNYGYIMGKLDSCLEQAYLKVSEVNSDHIPHEIYKSYLGGKTLMDGSRFTISRISKRYFNSMQNDMMDSFTIVEEEIKDIESYGNGLIQMLSEIEDFKNNN